MPASSRILSCNHGILSSTSYLPAARFCFPQEAPLFVENRSDSFQAIPHNSKCRYGERGAADAKLKAQIILDAAKVSAASGGNSEPKQGQRSQSARGFCPRSTMRVPQPDIIEYFGNADAVPQPPERRLSRKAGIVRYCRISETRENNAFRRHAGILSCCAGLCGCGAAGSSGGQVLHASACCAQRFARCPPAICLV